MSPPVTVQRRFSTLADGDFAVADHTPNSLLSVRRSLVDLPWCWLTQTHSAEVITVTQAEQAQGVRGDALVTTSNELVLGVQTADCVPVLLWSTNAIAAVHAGWRGAYDGILEATVRALRELDDSELSAEIGPHICPLDYEFGERDLTTLALRFGPDVVAVSASGTAAFDIFRAIETTLRNLGVRLSNQQRPDCTAHTTDQFGNARWYSHRARGDVGRQVSAIWRQP